MTARANLSLKILVTLLLAGALIGYTYFQARALVYGPLITIETPQSGTTVHDEVALITGTVKNSNNLRINDAVVYTDEKGRFEYKLLLAKGYTIIKIEARDRFNRSQQKILELVYN